MVTKHQLKDLGFSVRIPPFAMVHWGGNGICRREAILPLRTGNTLYVKGEQLFFIPKGQTIVSDATALWKKRHIGLSRMPLPGLSKIVSDCRAGLWLEWEVKAQMQTDLETSMWFGSIAPIKNKYTTPE